MSDHVSVRAGTVSVVRLVAAQQKRSLPERDVVAGNTATRIKYGIYINASVARNPDVWPHR